MPLPLPTSVGPWRVRRSTGPSEAFHAQQMPGIELADGSATYRPTIWLYQPSRPALVLGSTQPDGIVDQDRARDDGWEVCRRNSGGGLVVVQPEASVWIDVFIPPTHREWSDDVGRAFLFVGRWWLDALRRLTTASLRVHDGPLLHRETGRLLCFGGIGPGEVLMTGATEEGDGLGGKEYKVVGLSQRRSRIGARFQGLALLENDDSPALTYGSRELRDAVGASPAHGWPTELARPSPDAVIRSFMETAPA